MLGIGLIVLGVIAVAFAFGRSEGDSSSAPTTTALEPVASPDLGAGTTAPLGSGGIGEGVVDEPVSGRTPRRGFGEVAATLTTPDGRVCEVCLLDASTAEQRERGLMEVTDPELGGYDGMLFEYPDEVDGAFWMRNTPMPLSIAYFDEDGRFISATDMTPCEDRSTCPGYPADAPFAYAIEVPQGLLDQVGAVKGATLHLDARRCPLAAAGS